MIRQYLRRSLKAKLAMWSAVAMAVVVLVVTGVLLWVVQDELRRSAADAQAVFADAVALHLDERIEERRTALVQSAAVLGPLQLNDREALRDHFASRPLIHEMFDVVLAADHQGQMVFDAPPLQGRGEASIADRDYFRQVMATGRTVVSVPLLGRVTNEPVIVFATPLRNASGEATGVLMGAVYLGRANFLGKLAEVKIGKTGIVSVLAKGPPGVVIAHPWRDQLMGPVAAGSPAEHAVLGHDGSVEAADAYGQASILTFRNLKNAPWVIHTVYPTYEAHERLNQTRRLILGLGLLLMVLASAAIWLIVDRLLRPLDRLRDAMNATRDRAEPVVIAEPDQSREILEVVSAYNALMSHTQDARLQLEKSEQRVRLIADNIPVQLAYLDTDQRYVFVNEQFERAVGQSAPVLIGRTVRAVRGEKLYAQLEDRLAQALRDRAVTFEGEYQDRGETRHYRTDYVPDVADDGAVRGVFAMTQVITEQKLAELRRARSEARVVSILANAPDAFIAIDPDGRITDWNRQAELTFGWNQLEVIGRKMSEVLLPKSRQGLHDDDLQHFVTAGSGRVINNRTEGLALRRDGREIPVEISVAAVREGERFAAHAFLRDISERKAAEAKLAESELRLRMIADNLPVLIAYVDAEERLRFVNKTYWEWAGVDPVAAIGRTVLEVLGPQRYEARQAHLAAALAGQRVEFDLVSEGQGDDRYLHTVYMPDRLADGRVVGLYALSSDVTELKAVESRLQTQARVDPLTGLANRRAFDERLREGLARHQRSGQGMALLFLDLDHFKAINDTHGHGVGDGVLREFSRRLLSCVRANDTVARLAGDEFVIILEGLHQVAEAAAVAEKISAMMRIPFRFGEELQTVATSIGVAYLNEATIDVEGLMERADAALYRAKRSGRNTFAVTVL